MLSDVQSSSLIGGLKAAFDGTVLTLPDDTEPFLVDWRHQWRGQALGVALPRTTQEVAAIVKWASDNGVAIVPQGGNSGLSGGATPDEGPRNLVLSLRKMNRVRSVDPANNSMVVEAGCILANVQEAAHAAHRLFPLSLAAEGSCTIGGNLASNAGGTAVLRYGNARELCLGLEVVTPDGRTWDGLRALRKDNCGYQLRDLFIGSEGTLGIITAAVLKLFPLPTGRETAFLAVPSLNAAVTLLNVMQTQFNTALTAFELIGNESLGLVLDQMDGLRSPLETRAPFYVLLELSTGDAADRLVDTLSWALERELVLDATIAASQTQTEAIWAIRESITEAQARVGSTVKHDVSVPISSIPAFVAQASAVLDARFPQYRAIVFGHVGDGNLHYNFSPRSREEGKLLLSDQGALNDIVHGLAVGFGGSISAEHGLGVLRKDEAARLRPDVEFDLMRAVKNAIDPKGIMNPGKLL